MLQRSKAEEQRAIKASCCALKALAGAQQLIKQVFGMEGILRSCTSPYKL